MFYFLLECKMSDDVKVLLREARESFKQNEYLETMKKCKKILKKDKSNYIALVLLARAMQEVVEFKSQVALVLQKATEVQPDNPIAWQGLVTHYEKTSQNNEDWGKLAIAYCKLLKLDRYGTLYILKYVGLWSNTKLSVFFF